MPAPTRSAAIATHCGGESWGGRVRLVARLAGVGRGRGESAPPLSTNVDTELTNVDTELTNVDTVDTAFVPSNNKSVKSLSLQIPGFHNVRSDILFMNSNVAIGGHLCS
jgi:hypothetical protein